jgi:hypothetical protein
MTPKKALIIVIISVVFLSLLYFSESDRTRFARAYAYKSSPLCGFIFNGDLRNRCTAVIDNNVNLCNNIKDETEAFLCYYGAAINTGNPESGASLVKVTEDLCYRTTPLKSDNSSNTGGPKTEEELQKICKSQSLTVLSVFNKYLSIKNNDMSLCNSVDNENQKTYCSQILIGNNSFFCDGQSGPDWCIGMYGKQDPSYCKYRGDNCYALVSAITGNTRLCANIQNGDIRDSCALYFVEPPEFSSLGK